MNTATYDRTAGTSANTLQNLAELGGRVLLVSLFLLSGLGKIGAYAAIIAGWNTRIVAFLLAGFSLVSALLFHNDFANQIQMVMFLKNVSIAGGFLLLVAHGAGPLSLDRRAAKGA